MDEDLVHVRSDLEMKAVGNTPVIVTRLSD